MEFEIVKEYIEKIKDSEEFKKLDAFTHMTSVSKDRNPDIYENIKYYVSYFHDKKDCKEFFQPDYDFFMRFLKGYFNNEPGKLILDEKGRIDLTQTLHIVQPRKFGNEGCFIDKSIMLTDGSIYFCKIPLVFIGKSNVKNTACKYSALIASHIAKKIGVEAVDITLGTAVNGQPRIVSKNFLQPNQELITYTDQDKVSIVEHMKILEKELILRKFPKDEIEQTKFEFLKQEFVAKLIRLADQKAENSPIITQTDEEGKKHVKMAPMCDLDFSFHIGEENPYILTRKCDNGKDDIASFIEQYINYSGFCEFMDSSIQQLNLEEILKEIYESTGLIEFKDGKNNEKIMEFVNYVNKNIRISKRNDGKNI